MGEPSENRIIGISDWQLDKIMPSPVSPGCYEVVVNLDQEEFRWLRRATPISFTNLANGSFSHQADAFLFRMAGAAPEAVGREGWEPDHLEIRILQSDPDILRPHAEAHADPA